MILRHLLPFAVLLASLAGAAHAEEESWHLMLIGDQPSGYVHTVWAESNGADADHRFETRVDTLFRMKRMGREIEIRDLTIVHENRAGQIVAMKKNLGMSNVETIYDGRVQGDLFVFTVRTVGRPTESSIDWPGDVPGPRGVEMRLAATDFRSGARFKVPQFDFTVGEIIGLEHVIGEDRVIDLPSGPRRLHQVIATPDLPGLPATTGWVDDQGRMLKSSTTMIGVEFHTVLSDRDTVTRFREGAMGATAEVFMDSTVRSNVRLPRPRSLSNALYRIRPKREGHTLPSLEDERQKRVGGGERQGGMLLSVSMRVPPESRKQQRPLEDPGGELDEYLEPSAMMQSDDPTLVDLALSAVGEERDAWQAARLLERQVYETIDKKSMDVAFASALETCRTRQGDCSEHAVLLAALCRTVGIPSRIAMGVEYVGGIFGGHAWTEVWIDDSWYALDATLGRGAVDATHLRFGASSLKDGGFSGSLIGIAQTLGEIDLEVVEFAHGDERVKVGEGGTKPVVENGRFIDRMQGVSFDLPAGFSLDEEAGRVNDEAHPLSGRFLLARLLNARTGASIEFQIRQVPYDFSLERVRRRWKDRSMALRIVPRRISGADGLLALGGAGSAPFHAAATLIDDALYHLEASPAVDEPLEALLQLVESLHIRW